MSSIPVTSDEEDRESNHFAHYMDLVVLYHVAGNPKELFEKFPNYVVERRITIPDISDRFKDV